MANEQTPRIRAEFELDADGSPQVVEDGDLKHYKIRLFVEGAPEDVFAVTYRLHESYYDPTREVRRETPLFAEPITSFGDYDIQAEIRARSCRTVTSVGLVKALRSRYGSSASEPIKSAIEELSEH